MRIKWKAIIACGLIFALLSACQNPKNTLRKSENYDINKIFEYIDVRTTLDGHPTREEYEDLFPHRLKKTEKGTYYAFLPTDRCLIFTHYSKDDVTFTYHFDMIFSNDIDGEKIGSVKLGMTQNQVKEMDPNGIYGDINHEKGYGWWSLHYVPKTCLYIFYYNLEDDEFVIREIEKYPVPEGLIDVRVNPVIDYDISNYEYVDKTLQARWSADDIERL